MRSKSRILFLGLSLVWIAANIVWIGCAVMPLPPSHERIRPTSNFKFVKKSQPSRDEVTAKLGKADAYIPDLRIACYRVKTISNRGLVLWLLPPIPLGTDKNYAGSDLALIQFDETDHVKKYALVRQNGAESYESAAKKWVTSQAKPQGKR